MPVRIPVSGVSSRFLKVGAKVSIGMVGIKGEWWMPRHQRAMKDVA